MKRMVIAGLAVVLALTSTIDAECADNARLAELVAQDRADRSVPNVDFSIVTPRDRSRLNEVVAMLAEGKLVTALDFNRASWILNHGAVIDDYRLAYGLAQIAATLKPGDEEFRRMSVIAWNRLLRSQGISDDRRAQLGLDHNKDPQRPATLVKLPNLSHYGPRPAFDEVRAGMSEAEVIALLGAPATTETAGGATILVYGWDNPWDGRGILAETLRVHIVDGRVTATD